MTNKYISIQKTNIRTSITISNYKWKPRPDLPCMVAFWVSDVWREINLKIRKLSRIIVIIQLLVHCFMIIDWSMTTPGKRLNQAGTVIFLLSSPITVLFIVSHTVSWINLEPLNLISASLLASRGIVTWAFTLQGISWVHPTLKFWVFLHLWIQLPQVPVFPQSPILNLHIILGHTSLKSCTLTTPHFSPSFSRSLQLPRPCAVRQLWTQKPLEVRAGPPRSVRARALEKCPIGLGGSVDSREMSEPSGRVSRQ